MDRASADISLPTSEQTVAMPTFPLAFFDRLRMATDGAGVTALVGAYGCPLACKMCINPQTWQGRSDGKPPFVRVTPAELCERAKQDNLYYLATGGGITFGGGEPLVHMAFIEAFRAICPREWRFSAESCLHIDPALIPKAAAVVDGFMIDIKDMDPAVYRAYTTRDNAPVKENLRTLLALVGPARILVRVPHIPGYNTDEGVRASIAELREMGVTQIDEFTYRLPRKKTV